jgi:hypothetical protein
VALKLSSKQLRQREYLNTLPPRFQRLQAIIEQMSSLQADDATVRAFCRILDEVKAGCQQYGMSGLSETAGLMATMGRRGGGVQMKVRGLRELLGSLKTNYEGALKKASTPGAVPDDEQEQAP